MTHFFAEAVIIGGAAAAVALFIRGFRAQLTAEREGRRL